MVKKVGGKPPKPGIKTDSVQSTKTVQSNKVDRVGSTTRKDAAGKVQASAQRITPENHPELLQLIEEEAEKLFGDSGLPANKKESIKGAIRMAIEASMLKEEEDQDDK